MPSPVVLQEKTIVQPGRSQMLVQLHTSVYSVFPNFRDNVDDFIAVAEAEFDGRQIVVFDLSDIFGPQSRQFLFRRGDTVYQDRHTAIGRGDLIGLAVDSDLRNLVGQIETRDRRLPVFIGDGIYRPVEIAGCVVGRDDHRIDLCDIFGQVQCVNELQEKILTSSEN